VQASEPETLALIQGRVQLCFPLTHLLVVRHEPDNRFVERVLAVEADYLVTVNPTRGHFDRERHGSRRVVTPREFVDPADVQPLLRDRSDEP
jgi:predicted nucleic acid-binding protein